MKSLLCGIAKCENHYIREWVEYYKELGFDNILLIDNNDVDGERFEDVIGDYINQGYVILMDRRGVQYAQQKSYKEAYDFMGAQYDWMAFFDIDEYMEIDKSKYSKVNDFLSDEIFKNADMIRISWKHFDDNGLVKVIDKNYSVRERFTREVDKNEMTNSWTKGIVRCKFASLSVSMGVDGMHMVQISEVKNAVNCIGKKVSNETIRNGRVWENAWLCHYTFKTIEEYVQKRKRGWSVNGYDKAFTDKLFTLDNFFRFNERTKEKEDLFNNLIQEKKNNKYLVLSYNINDYEIIHPILEKSDRARYVMVVDKEYDEKEIGGWEIFYDKSLRGLTFEKCYQIRFNPFKYCKEDENYVVRIDGSVGINKNIDKLVDSFIESGDDLMLMQHPDRNTLFDEYNMWCLIRGYDKEHAKKLLKYLIKQCNFDVINYKGLPQLCFQLLKRSDVNANINLMTFAFMRMLGDEKDKIERLDQTIYGFVIQKFFPDIKLMWVNQYLYDGNYFTWYLHKSDTPQHLGRNYKLIEPYFFDKKVEKIFNLE